MCAEKYNISPTIALQVQIQSEDEKTREIMETHRDLIIDLARLSSLEVQNTGKRPKSSATAVVNSASVFVFLEGIIEFAKETKRLGKRGQKAGHRADDGGKKIAE